MISGFFCVFEIRARRRDNRAWVGVLSTPRCRELFGADVLQLRYSDGNELIENILGIMR